MAKNKKSIIVYADWKEKFDCLTDEEAGRLIKHFFRYVNDENPTPPDRITEIAFIDIKHSLKRDLEKWESTVKARSEAGKKSAEKRKQKQQKSTKATNVNFVKQKSTKATDSVNVSVSVNDSVNDSVNVNDINNKKIPDFKDFLSYALDKAKELNIKIDEVRLNLKYQSWKENNWCDGNNNKIKNWKSKVLNIIPYVSIEKNNKDKKPEKRVADIKIYN